MAGKSPFSGAKSPPTVPGAGPSGSSASGGAELGRAAAGAEGAAGSHPAVMVAKAAADLAVKGLSAGAKGLGMALTTLNSGLQELQGPLGPVGLGFAAIAKGGELAGKALGESIDAVVGPARELTQTLVEMARVASPGTFKIWSIALQDVQGVIGQAFTPVLATMTEGVRLFGDVLATILPNMSEVNAVLDEMRPDWEGFKEEIQAFASEFGPTIRDVVIKGLREISSLAGLVARGLGALTRQLGIFLRGLGWSAPEGEQEMRSNVGAAAQPAHFSGLEDYARQLQTSALSLPAGAADSPQVQTVNWLDRINGVMEAVNGTLTAIRASVDAVIQMFSRSVADNVASNPIVASAGRTLEQATGIGIGPGGIRVRWPLGPNG